MRMNFKPYVWVLVTVLSGGITGGAVRVLASPAGQDQDHDYSKNKRYQQGLREGRDDVAHNRDHFRQRHFKKDEDQRAYEAGYREGHQGEHHDDHDQH